jgi:ring-1,2-phenylacetyl-CoA epoxidase subunit PaaC
MSELDAHWAFGAGFADPLAEVDMAVPPGVDATALAQYCLMLGDDALVAAQRLAEWCSNAPDLEEDLALANVALDLLGQARWLLRRAAAADPSVVPALPPGSPVDDEDALAYFRDAEAFRNVRLVEAPDRDFAEAVVRLLLFSTWRLALLVRLRASGDPVLAGLAARAVHEVAHHRDFAARWVVTLALGTPESTRRTRAALATLLPLWPELFVTHPVEEALPGAAVPSGSVAEEADRVLDEVLAAAGLQRPDQPPLGGAGGRDFRHTEALSLMLAEMQVVARAHPSGRW